MFDNPDATSIVTNAVRCVFQTYVESLKASGTFDIAAQKALTKVKNLVISELSESAKKYMINNYGDLTTLANIQIEATINILKSM